MPYHLHGMETLIDRLSRAARLTPAETADELDKVLHRIRRRLRDGEPAVLPGLGVLRPGTGEGKPAEFQKEAARAAPVRRNRR